MSSLDEMSDSEKAQGSVKETMSTKGTNATVKPNTPDKINDLKCIIRLRRKGMFTIVSSLPGAARNLLLSYDRAIEQANCSIGKL